MATITSPLTITPVHPAFGALVSGVDLTRPLDDATFERIAVAFDDHSVLVFRGQALSDAQQMAFSERWGPLETTVRTLGGEDRLGAHIVDLSNTDADGKLMGWDDRRMHLPVRQPALAQRQLVQAGARPLLRALRPRDPARGRRDRVREHARRVRNSR